MCRNAHCISINQCTSKNMDTDICRITSRLLYVISTVGNETSGFSSMSRIFISPFHTKHAPPPLPMSLDSMVSLDPLKAVSDYSGE